MAIITGDYRGNGFVQFAYVDSRSQIQFAFTYLPIFWNHMLLLVGFNNIKYKSLKKALIIMLRFMQYIIFNVKGCS